MKRHERSNLYIEPSKQLSLNGFSFQLRAHGRYFLKQRLRVIPISHNESHNGSFSLIHIFLFFFFHRNACVFEISFLLKSKDSSFRSNLDRQTKKPNPRGGKGLPVAPVLARPAGVGVDPLGSGQSDRGDLSAQRSEGCRLPQLRQSAARPQKPSLHLRHKCFLPKMLVEKGKLALRTSQRERGCG